MEKIKKFVERFCIFDILNIHKIGRKYWQVIPEVWDYKETIKKDTFYLGVFLGEEKKEFIPSLGLLEIISKKSAKKVFVNKKGEWLFTCKRDVFGENILKKQVQQGACLVQNEKDENIGYGIFQNKKNSILKPLLDKGDFLRRE